MFIYLSKKIAIPNGVHLRCASWNATEVRSRTTPSLRPSLSRLPVRPLTALASHSQGWIACGGDEGMLKVLKLESATVKGGQQGGNLSMNQTLEGHKGSVVVADWNPRHDKLTTSDQNGLIIVWMLHKGMWFEEMINNRNESVVRDMRWSKDGEKICIAYEDGHVIVGGAGGKRLWGKDLPLTLSLCEWSPDGRFVLFGTASGQVLLYDSSGHPIAETRVVANEGVGASPLVAIDWHPGAPQVVDDRGGAAPTLAVCFANGNVQLMRGARDDAPLVLRTGLRASHARWNAAGTHLAVAGVHVSSDGRDVNAVHFYTPLGSLACSLRVPGAKINAMCWEASGTRVALAVDSFVYFANIAPDYKWGYFGNTLVYAPEPITSETEERDTRAASGSSRVVFWDSTRLDATRVKDVKRLIMIRAAGERCVLVAHGDTPGTYALTLCDAIGSPVASKTFEVEPRAAAMTSTHVVVASHSVVFLWRYRGGGGTDDETRTFHVDSDARDGAFGDASSYGASNDPVTAVAASEKTVLVARKSGAMTKFGLPGFASEGRLATKCRARVLALNCKGTKFAAIDASGTLSVFDVPPKSSENAAAKPVPVKATFQKKDAWDVRWSDDDEHALAAMEKTKMVVYRGAEPEQPVVSSAHICAFRDLTVRAVALDEIMRAGSADSFKPRREHVFDRDTFALRDARRMLAEAADASEAFRFAERGGGHPRLWRLLAEHALERHDLTLADKAFVRCSDYHGIQFVKRLKRLESETARRGEIAAYFKRFDDAERIFLDADRADLAVELRKNVGDWFSVEKLVQNVPNAGDDDTLHAAWRHIGDYFADRRRWDQAAAFYLKTRDPSRIEKLAECFYALEDFEALRGLIEEVPDGNRELLRSLARKFVGVGLCAPAVSAYVRAGDVKAAVDACVSLSRWDRAVALAEQHDFRQIEGLLSKYAAHLLDTKRHVDAVDLFTKAGKHLESANVLRGLAEEAAARKNQAVRAKKLYVLAALEAAAHRRATARGAKTLSSERVDPGTATKVSALDGLTALDDSGHTYFREEHSTAKSKNAPPGERTFDAWRAAAAFHFWVLAQRQLYENRFEYARRTASVCTRFEDFLNPADIYSLLAIASYYSRHYGTCSRAFAKLESLPVNENENGASAYADLATEIFTRHAPRDPGGRPNSDAELAEPFSSSFPGGGSAKNVCVASGRRIGAADHARTCATCERRSIEGELRGRETCPLCHARFDGAADSANSARLFGAAREVVDEEVVSPTAPSLRTAGYSYAS